LWPETVEAIRDVLANRKPARWPEHAQLVFLTRTGRPWFYGTASGMLGASFCELLRQLSINGRKGLGFYTLRHTFRTVADEAKDQPAADYIMGHEIPHMSTVYRERISDERLRAVTDHVHRWLFGGPEGPQEG
jgi:integrase